MNKYMTHTYDILKNIIITISLLTHRMGILQTNSGHTFVQNILRLFAYRFDGLAIKVGVCVLGFLILVVVSFRSADF